MDTAGPPSRSAVRHATLSSALLGLFLTGLTPAAPAQVIEFGLVDSITVRPAGSVRRATGDTVSISLLAPVFGGDSLALAPRAMVRVRTYGGESIWFCGAEVVQAGCRRNRVPASPPRNRRGAVSAVFAAFGQPVLDLFRRGRWGRQVGTYVRGNGDPPAIPLLDPVPALGAGRRSLELAWRGGAPPFVVRLVQVDRRREAGRLQEIRDSTAEFPALDLEPGEWLVEVIDSGQRTIQRGFRVVPAGDVPVPPDSALHGWSGLARQVLANVWLAGREDGRWAWEAWLRLAPAARTDPIAVRIRAELAEGRVP